MMDMKRLLLAGLMVLGIMAAPVKVMGQTTSNLLPDEYTSEGLITREYASEGNKGVKWRFYPNTFIMEDNGSTILFRHTLRLQSYSGRNTVTKNWEETSYTTQSYDIETATQWAVMTYYESSDNMISTIADGAFSNFTNLESVVLPKNVNGVTIGTNAFYGCENLQTAYNMEYAYTVNPEAFKDTPLRNSINGLNAKARLFSIGSSCNSTLTSGVINGLAFKNTKLSRVHIGNNIAIIGQSAFEGCSLMTELTIGDNVTSIGTDAFRGCTNLSNIMFGKSLPGGVDLTLSFPSAMNLNTIEISDDNPYYTDEGGCLVDITTQTLRLGTCNTKNIPQGVVTIGKKAFYGRTGLESVALPATVTTISSNAFNGCTALREFICNATTPPTYGANAFTGIPDDAILYVPTPAAVTAYADSEWYIYFKDIRVGVGGTDTNGIFWTITQESDGNYTLTISGNGAMTDYNDTGKAPWSRGNIGTDVFNKITKVVIDEGVTHIGEYALSHLGNANSNDVKVEFPSTLTSIGSYAFSFSYGLKNLEIPSSVNNIGTAIHYYCKNLSAITTSKDNTTYYTKDNCLIEYSSNTLVIGCYTSTIPDGVEIIAPYAFSGQNQLDEIALPSSLTSVGARAFYSCSRLTSISFGKAVNYIGDYAFYNCSSLSSVTCLAYEAPTLFNNTFSSKPTLHVYYTPNYSSHSSKFKSIEAIPVTITDGAVDNYEDIYEEDVLLSRVEYNRTLLADSKWNALYVPFEIPVADIIDKYDVAYINDVRLYDSDNDGEIDENGMEVEVVYVKSGTLNANTPYLIRVKKSLAADAKEAARNMNLSLSTRLCPAVEDTFDCSSVYKTFKFSGIYSRRMSEEIPGALAIAGDGNWHTISQGSWLNPFRIFLTIENRDGTPYQPTSTAAIRIRMVGEEETTGIENQESTGNGQQSTVIYDLAGRRVETPTKGIYIINGKKTVIK